MWRTAIAISALATVADAARAQWPDTRDQKRAQAIAAVRGWATRGEDGQGRVFELQFFERGLPRYYITHNIDAADSVSSDECWSGGSGGLGLSGAGVTLGIWDAGRVYTNHQEFQGRATQADSPSSFSWHSTHVGCTMIGGGLWPGGSGYPSGQSKGMSPQAALECRDWNSDESEMNAAAAAGLRVSNHSYGFVTGWEYGNFGAGTGWYWWGNVTVSTVEDHQFGRYDDQARDWDQIVYQNPRFLFVKSAGNDRDDSGPGPGGQHYYWQPGVGWSSSTATRNPDGNNGYDSTSHAADAKNGLTVGAVQDVIGGYGSPAGVVMTSFSCWGPADDGRIKPDIVANGYQLFSAHSVSGSAHYYASASGTSMSTPNTSGSLGLLIEHWRDTHPAEPDMLASTLKGLVIHTADECGSADGPDYRFGWGLLNTLRAAQSISADVTTPLTISEWDLIDGNSVELILVTDGTSSELRATICWTDPPGTPPANTLDNPAKMLVNDLDLRIEADGGPVYAPWVLELANPSAAASTGDNDTDNVEQVVVPSPGVGTYALRVTHKGALSGGSQVFSVLVAGASEIREPGATIAGHVMTSLGTPIPNVAVRATASGESDTTDATGYYELSLPFGTSETVVPCRDGWRFSPPSRTYDPVTGNLDEENYVGTFVYDVDPPGVGDEFVGVGDLSRFATSWQQDVPPADPLHDFDCDGFVGVGDFSYFVTAWLKSVFDTGMSYPACWLCSGGSREPNGAPWIELHLVAVVQPSPEETLDDLPQSSVRFVVGQPYFVELWARDIGPAATGLLTSVYADVALDIKRVEAKEIHSGTLFNMFPSGSIGESMVDELGGSTVHAAAGSSGSWARVAMIELQAAAPGQVRYELQESKTGLAAYGRGRVAWESVERFDAWVEHVELQDTGSHEGP